MAIKCQKCKADNPESLKFCGECGTQLGSSEGPQVSKTMTLETPAEGLTRGTLFAGRYEIIEELGTGGMGSVFRAEDTKIRQEVALKLIRPEIASSRRTIERFRNEIKTARMIAHRNVCRMFDLGEEKGTYFITMEYVAGEDMKSFLRRAAPLNTGRAISIGKQICEGLAEAHRLGVVHRDLKPGNIMIDKEGNARIMDFGIARSIAEKGITGTGVMIGTPEYMSPEQAEGKEADQRSDIYSLGVILFEMVTGRVPFEGETALSIAQKHRYEPASDPRTINPQIPEDISRLILRCLEKEKEKRYQTAVEVQAELETIEQQIPSTDRVAPTRRPFTSKEITVKFTLRKVFIPALAAGFIIIAAFFGWRFLSNKAPAPGPTIENSIAVISLRNQTGDGAYDYLCQRAIPDLLITNLENSGYFYVATWERMLDLLKQMGKRDVQSIDSELGFEICRREGIKFIVSGSLTKAGETFMADIKILDAETKKLLKGIQSRGRGEDSILEAQIDQLSRDICSGIGIGQDKIQEARLRIADVATSSIEAYNHYLRGLDLNYQYKWNDARISFEKAVQIDPSFASAYRWLAYVLSNVGEHGASEKAIEQARLFSDRATEKEKLYIEIQIALIQGGGGKYIPALEELISRYPKEKEAHWWFGITSFDLAGYDQAIKEFEIVFELDPDFADACNFLAVTYTKIGKFEKSLEFGKKYASMLPDNANPLDTIGATYFFWGKLDKAMTYFQKAIDIDSNLFGPYHSLAYTSALREDYPSAMKWIDRLLEKNLSQGDQANAFVFRGFLETWLGRIEQSLVDFDRAAELYANDDNEEMVWFTSCCKAIASGEKGEYELSQKLTINAFEYFAKKSGGQTALEKAELSYNLAWNDLMLGRLESAKKKLGEIEASLPDISDVDRTRYYSEEGSKRKMEYLHDVLKDEISIREQKVDTIISRTAFADAPEFLSYFSNLWHIMQTINYLNFPPPFVRDVVPRAYIQKGEFDKAIAAYERLVTFNPQSKDRRLIHPLNYYRLAKLYEQSDHKDEARARYKKFLDLRKNADPGRPEVDDARKRLADLSKS